MRNINYETHPFIETEGKLHQGWSSITTELNKKQNTQSTIVIDCYLGVDLKELAANIQILHPDLVIDTYSLLKNEEELKEMQDKFLTEDVLFGFMAHFEMIDFFDPAKLAEARKQLAQQEGKKVVYGYGAALVGENPDCLVFADMARWEIQLRSRQNRVRFLGTNAVDEPVSTKHKRGYFIEWKTFDRHKRKYYECVDFWLDTHVPNQPKMIDKETFFRGIDNTVNKPFRVVPFFDAAPWGGQWMKEVCDLDKSVVNYGWCFDCVPEENSLLLKVEGILFEMPSINLVYLRSEKLLGTRVEARFGKEFPIRFDLLDTFDGGNLSLQVHPTTEFVRENFGIFYTQDESYYILDAEEDGIVYLGLQNGVDATEMFSELKKAEKGEIIFDADRFANKLPARKHDHFLIPGGTLHCSGKNTLVLEISSTPNIFTFKLWDWARLGLDGKPRPINVSRGEKVLDKNRDFDFVKKHLWNAVTPIQAEEGFEEERTGLHENEFIETERQKFIRKIHQKTFGSVNVINLAEGDEIIVESPTGKFSPFVVHYAESFVIPAWVEEYTLTPYGKSEGKKCVTIKAYVRP